MELRKSLKLTPTIAQKIEDLRREKDFVDEAGFMCSFVKVVEFCCEDFWQRHFGLKKEKAAEGKCANNQQQV